MNRFKASKLRNDGNWGIFLMLHKPTSTMHPLCKVATGYAIQFVVVDRDPKLISGRNELLITNSVEVCKLTNTIIVLITIFMHLKNV